VKFWLKRHHFLVMQSERRLREIRWITGLSFECCCRIFWASPLQYSWTSYRFQWLHYCIRRHFVFAAEKICFKLFLDYFIRYIKNKF
jgi:hypothetical protein